MTASLTLRGECKCRYPLPMMQADRLYYCERCSLRVNSLTGFEGKPLRTVIENWLYNAKDLETLFGSTTELRRRLSKTFKCPDWAKGESKQ